MVDSMLALFLFRKIMPFKETTRPYIDILMNKRSLDKDGNFVPYQKPERVFLDYAWSTEPHVMELASRNKNEILGYGNLDLGNEEHIKLKRIADSMLAVKERYAGPEVVAGIRGKAAKREALADG